MYFLPCDFCLPCVFLLAHGKWTGCRVPEILHTAKIGAHGEVLDSGRGRRFDSTPLNLACGVNKKQSLLRTTTARAFTFVPVTR